MDSELEIALRERMQATSWWADTLPTARHRLQKAGGRDSTKRPLIAVDVGGTVEDTRSAKRSWFATKGFEIGRNALGRREVVAQVGGGEDLYEAMVSEVYSDAAIASHQLTEGCAEALKLLAAQFRVVLLTSRPAHQYAITGEWLASHRIGGLIDGLVCVGHSRSKVEWCRAMNASFIVDDDMRHLETVGVNEGLRAIHFGVAKDIPPHPGSAVLSAFTWPDVVSIVRRHNPLAESRAATGVEP